MGDVLFVLFAFSGMQQDAGLLQPIKAAVILPHFAIDKHVQAPQQHQSLLESLRAYSCLYSWQEKTDRCALKGCDHAPSHAMVQSSSLNLSVTCPVQPAAISNQFESIQNIVIMNHQFKSS